MIETEGSIKGDAEVTALETDRGSSMRRVLNAVPRAGRLRSQHGRAVAADALLMLFARAASQGATFIMMVMVARVLGASEFGLFSFAMTAALLISEFPGTGLDMTAVHLASTRWVRERPIADLILRVAGEAKLMVAVALATLGLATADFVSTTLFGRPELATPLRVAFLAAPAMALAQYGLAVLQTYQLFRRCSLVTLGAGLAKIVAALGIFVLGLFTLGAAMASLLAGVYLGLVLSCVLVPGPVLKARGVRASQARHIFAYGKWLVVATFLGSVANGLDIIALTYLSSPDVVGLYSSGRTLAMAIPLVSSTVLAMLLPKASRITDRRALIRYIARAEALVAALAAGVGGLILVAPWLIELLFTQQYGAATGLFQVMALAYTVDLLAVPLWTLLLAKNRPDALAIMNVALLVIVVPAFMLAIPHLGAMGAALVFLAWKVLGGLASAGWVFHIMPAGETRMLVNDERC